MYLLIFIRQILGLKLFNTFLIFILGFNFYAQKVGKVDETSIFFTTIWSSSDRFLEPNDGFFGEPLEHRIDENKLSSWSFSLGFRSKIHKNIAWEGAISYLRNGESYIYEDLDTLYKYESQYSYIAVPLKIFFTYGDNVRLLVGGGIVPQMFTGFEQNIESEDSNNTIRREELKTKIGYNSFVASIACNIGVELNLVNSWSIILLPEYRLQLMSSLDRNAAYKHRAYSLGGHIGFVFEL